MLTPQGQDHPQGAGQRLDDLGLGLIDDPTVHLTPQTLGKGEKTLLIVDSASDLGGGRDPRVRAGAVGGE